jgi:hypothetical protein
VSRVQTKVWIFGSKENCSLVPKHVEYTRREAPTRVFVNSTETSGGNTIRLLGVCLFIGQGEIHNGPVIHSPTGLRTGWDSVST